MLQLIEFVTAWRLCWLRPVLKVMCDPNYLMNFVLTSVFSTASLAGVVIAAIVCNICGNYSEGVII